MTFRAQRMVRGHHLNPPVSDFPFNTGKSDPGTFCKRQVLNWLQFQKLSGPTEALIMPQDLRLDGAPFHKLSDP